MIINRKAVEYNELLNTKTGERKAGSLVECITWMAQQMNPGWDGNWRMFPKVVPDRSWEDEEHEYYQFEEVVFQLEFKTTLDEDLDEVSE